MDSTTTLLLTFGGLLAVALLVIGGLVLSGRAYTTLTELIRLLGSQLIQPKQDNPPAATASLRETENAISSQTPPDTLMEQDK